MSDAQLRALERAARDTPPRSLEREQWLAARRRVGQVLTRRLWKTKDGRTLRIVDMPDDHLLNAERFLRRRASEIRAEGFFVTGSHASLLNALAKEARQRGLPPRNTASPEGA